MTSQIDLARPPDPALAVEARAVSRVYRSRTETVTALHGVDLAVGRGELFGILGPNGAGKSTLIKILVTLLLPSGGRAFVDGFDVVTQPGALRHRISLVAGGDSSGFGPLQVREQLWMFSQFYGLPSKAAYARIDELLERLGLSDAAGRRVNALSSGMRQKMNLARGLMTDPSVLFLDEPTVALDVGAARDLRDEVRRWMREDPGRSVILTTHYMQEADDLCDRIAIVSHGRMVALGSPAELKAMVADQLVVDLHLLPGEPLLDRLRGVEGVNGAAVEEADGVDRFSLMLRDENALDRVTAEVEASGRRVRGLMRREPSLEDAFVRLTGHSMAEDEARAASNG